MLKKVTVFVFGVAWAGVAYVLWPEAVLEQPTFELSLDEWYRLVASVVTVVVGVVAGAMMWRS